MCTKVNIFLPFCSCSAEDEDIAGDREDDDRYGLATYLQIFNTTELCVRYTDRLSKDISRSGEAVFAAATGECV